MTIRRSCWRVNGSYSARISSCVRGLSVPTTTRSGFMKSSIAAPSFEEFGVRDDVELARSTLRAFSVFTELRAHLVGGADRHGGLGDDDGIAVGVRRDRRAPRRARNAGRPSHPRPAGCRRR